MASLLAIGFGLLVLGLRLIMLWSRLRHIGTVPVTPVHYLRKEGLVVSVPGLVALLLGIFCSSLPNAERTILMGAGESMMILSLLSLVQWVVQTGRGTKRHVFVWALVVTVAGFVTVLVYAGYSVGCLRV